MRPFFASLVILGLAAHAYLAGNLRAGVGQLGEPQAKLVFDAWDVAYLQGARAGYVHTSVHEFEKDNAKLLRATVELRLTVLRSGEIIQLAMDTGTYETMDGKVVGTFLKQFLGTAKTLEITGIVDGNQIRLALDKSKSLKPAPWDPEVTGLARAQRLFQERDMKPGTEFTYLSFEPSINLVVKNTVRAKDFEEVVVFGSKQKKRMLRVESRPEKIQNVQLPTLVSWLGADLVPVRAEAEIPPFGRMTFYRTTKANALAPGGATGGVAKLTDIGTSQYVKLTKRVANPYETTAALYHVTIRDEEDVLGVFAHDERQQVKKIQGQTVQLQVRAKGGIAEESGAPSSKYTQSSYFITCADDRVKALAGRAVNGERDPWKKALLIERFVNHNMKVTSDEALAPADHVARTLRGDCTEFAMLTAAMCRAEGIPSRTAVGLIYADVRGGPVFAFHMWTEVWVAKRGLVGDGVVSGRAQDSSSLTPDRSSLTPLGKWVPLDATLGKGYVGATHLKISDQSWQDTYDQAPLLPVFRVLGKLSIEVLRTEGR